MASTSIYAKTVHVAQLIVYTYKLFEFAKRNLFLWIYFVCVIQLTMNDEKKKKIYEK